MQKKLTRILQKTLQQHKLFPPGEMIVLAVSGGVDSLALLHSLSQLQEMFPNRYHVATLDHGLRDESGAADAAFVQEFAQQMEFPCSVGTADVAQLASEQNIGIEEAARIARYDFLAQVALNVGATTIATGHHADDQAETILMHLLRGAGLQGLRGMDYQTTVLGHPALRLVRPLLDISREMIHNYCAENGLKPRTDETNTDTTYLRNRIRLEVLPQLQAINPQFNEALLRMAESATTDDHFLNEMFQQQILPAIKQSSRRMEWETATFKQWRPAMQRRAIRFALEQLGAQPDYQQVIHACEFAQHPGVGVTMPFNQGVRLRFGYDNMLIEQDDTPLSDHDYLLLNEPRSVALPGVTHCGDWQLVATSEERADSSARLAIPENARATLRTRQPGDRWKPLGMGGHSRTIKKWMIDQKIPQHLRDQLPIFLINGEIAAIILPSQWAISDVFATHETSQHVFYFSVQKL